MNNLTPTGKASLSTIFAAAKAKVEATRGRLVFGFDATASRGSAWAAAMEIQKAMFAATTGLEVQLAVFRGDQLDVSRWESSASALSDLMNQIQCMAGGTQIERLLTHIMDENAKTPLRPINAFVFIGDTFEENHRKPAILALAKALGDLKVPGFFFLDSGTSDPYPNLVSTFKELSSLTGGAYAPFNLGAVDFLRDLLAAVGAFASGGLKALGSKDSDAARLLLTQLRK